MWKNIPAAAAAISDLKEIMRKADVKNTVHITGPLTAVKADGKKRPIIIAASVLCANKSAYERCRTCSSNKRGAGSMCLAVGNDENKGAPSV